MDSLFVPYSLINIDNSFFESGDIDDVLLFDRHRILEFVKHTEFYNELKSKKIIEKCLNTRVNFIN